MKKYYTLFLLGVISLSVSAQQVDTVFLKNLLMAQLRIICSIQKHPTNNEVQILYYHKLTGIKNNVPHFTSYSYRLDANHYFYPASTVKLPHGDICLEKINELKIKGLSRSTPMLTDSSFFKGTDPNDHGTLHQ